MDRQKIQPMTGYMEERPGVKSNIRLMSLICLFWAIIFAMITIVGKAGDTNTGLIITGFFLGFAFFPKVIQKYAEGMILKYMNLLGAEPDPGRNLRKPETITPSFLK